MSPESAITVMANSSPLNDIHILILGTQHRLPYVAMGLQLQLRIFRGTDYTGLFGRIQCNHKGYYE